MTGPSRAGRVLALNLALACGFALPAAAQDAPSAPAASAPTESGDTGAAPASEAAMGEWHTSSGLIEPSRYADDFTHYDYVNPDAPKGGTWNSSAPGTYDSFNPFIIRGTPAAGFAAFGGGIAYDTLMAQAPDEPGVSHALIAEAVRYPSDYSSVSFRLDPDARFQDGEPITVNDVIWSFETVTRLYPLYANYYHNVTSVEETGEREVTFRFDQTGNRELPNIMGDLVVLPRHYWEAEGRDIEEPTLEVPVGSGPYRVASFNPGSTITWERVPDYWAADKAPQRGRYNFDRINFTYFRDQNAAWEAFKRGGYQDYRIENRAQLWAEGYNFPAFTEGRVKKAELESDAVWPMQAYVINSRREKFSDPRVRRAFVLAYNFQEMNRTLFYDLYQRIDSYFDNSELAATGLPEGDELALLEPLRDDLPPELFTQEYTLPDYSQPSAERTYLREAFELLQAAGWERRGSQLVNAAGQPFTVEFMTSDQNASRVMEPFAASLRRLGIDATIRVVDPSQYLALTDSFEFDIVTDSFAQSLSPGNEQRDFWSSAAASQNGSRNSPGVRNAAVDALIEKIIYAPDREALVAATRALDRTLLWNNYVVPQFTNGAIWLAYWDKFGMPENGPAYNGIDPFSWWIRADAPAEAAPEPEGLPEGATPPTENAVPGGEDAAAGGQ
ncbi:extracellular solute-binding protein [Aureimonas mangrovi]|uniref:extracellular solute-binding protein n=1 Tax=Aureimonas mangrovi TaxID=2758041 RepID=UPI001FECEB21|nr:extracellular solute-binding protein [Aureimonas mangrovi]